MPAVVLALTRSEAAARLGIGAAVAVGAWLLLLALLAAATRARRPNPGPASMELAGSEPPAIVSMLVNRWRVGREAVPATLIDLAARRVLAIETVGPERFVCRLRPESAGSPDLTPYESQVLRHVRGLAASDGTVPCEALTTGPESQSTSWWSTFEKAVVKDARDRNLSRGRWSGWMLVLLAVTALAPSLLAAGALVALPDQKGGKDSGNPVGGFIGVAAMVEVGLLAIPGKLRAERDTPTGRQAAARWLGLQEYLHEDGAFSDAPPAAVAVWDRYLSYGAALGVAAAAVRALPLGSESDTVAWSSYGGRWHMVRIDYPKKVPPGWGRHPALASVIGLASLAAGLAVAKVFFPPMLDAASRVADSVRDHGFQAFDLLGVGLLAIPTTVTAVWVVRSALMLAAALPDLAGPRQVDGVALRVRVRDQPYLAVDDGTRATVRAWLVEPTVLDASGVYRGELVRATVSPRLGHVFRLEKLPVVPGPG